MGAFESGASTIVSVLVVKNPPLLIIVVTKDWYFLSHRIPLARTLQNAGFNVAIAAHDTGRASEIRALGFDFYNISFDRKSINPLTEIISIWQLFRLYLRLKPSIVHHIAIKSCLYGGLAARAAQVPYIFTTITGLGYLFSPSGILPKLLRLVVSPLFKYVGKQSNSAFIFFNRADRSAFVNQGFAAQERSGVIPGSGVDTHNIASRPEPTGVPVVLCACRLLADKGIRELIEAARILRQQGLNFRLIIAGRPDTSNRKSILDDEISRWRAEGVAEFPGFVDDIPSLLAASHIAVLPSYYPEGVPLFLIEAAACGRAAITCATPGCEEIVLNNKTGILVPPRNAAALVDALRSLLLDIDKRKAFGAEARLHCEAHYSKDVVGRLTLEFYDRLLGHGLTQVSQQTTRLKVSNQTGRN
jgi:glycosyltransferase involved in cell wall biosynthesis